MAQKSILNGPVKTLIKKYQKVLKENDIPVDKLILFGSRAKGKAKPWSDIDLCVVSKKFGKNSFDESVFLGKLTLDIEPLIEAHPYHPKDLENPYDPLAYEIKKHGKVVG